MSRCARPVFKSWTQFRFVGGGEKGLLSKKMQSLSVILGSVRIDPMTASASFHTMFTHDFE